MMDEALRAVAQQMTTLAGPTWTVGDFQSAVMRQTGRVLDIATARGLLSEEDSGCVRVPGRIEHWQTAEVAAARIAAAEREAAAPRKTATPRAPRASTAGVARAPRATPAPPPDPWLAGVRPAERPDYVRDSFLTNPRPLPAGQVTLPTWHGLEQRLRVTFRPDELLLYPQTAVSAPVGDGDLVIRVHLVDRATPVWVLSAEVADQELAVALAAQGWLLWPAAEPERLGQPDAALAADTDAAQLPGAVIAVRPVADALQAGYVLCGLLSGPLGCAGPEAVAVHRGGLSEDARAGRRTVLERVSVVQEARRAPARGCCLLCGVTLPDAVSRGRRVCDRDWEPIADLGVHGTEWKTDVSRERTMAALPLAGWRASVLAAAATAPSAFTAADVATDLAADAAAVTGQQITAQEVTAQEGTAQEVTDPEGTDPEGTDAQHQDEHHQDEQLTEQEAAGQEAGANV